VAASAEAGETPMTSNREVVLVEAEEVVVVTILSTLLLDKEDWEEMIPTLEASKVKEAIHTAVETTTKILIKCSDSKVFVAVIS